ncbi:MAG: CvpA family protein [Bacteroidota bacterium]|nr:CvpA family protein [Bacteroidota bacterium]
MVLDIIFAVILILAIIKGYQRGLIVGVFSFIAIIIGLAAAIKLSAVVAAYIGKSLKGSNEWLPVISFVLVFLIVVLLVRWIANIIQRGIEIAMLGWVNRLGGILLYAAISIVVFSVFVFYAEQVHLLRPQTIDRSLTYTFVQPWGPKAINSCASVMPVFKNMFTELKDFFGGVSDKIFRV